MQLGDIKSDCIGVSYHDFCECQLLISIHILFSRHWLKAVISLTMVMGFTWIIGVLVIEVEELCPLAYIFTIFVAFQGLFIFVIFVLLSKQVRENYAKWWKAKVAESDFLSKHFGEKSISSSAVVRRKLIIQYKYRFKCYH